MRCGRENTPGLPLIARAVFPVHSGPTALYCIDVVFYKTNANSKINILMSENIAQRRQKFSLEYFDDNIKHRIIPEKIFVFFVRYFQTWGCLSSDWHLFYMCCDCQDQMVVSYDDAKYCTYRCERVYWIFLYFNQKRYAHKIYWLSTKFFFTTIKYNILQNFLPSGKKIYRPSNKSFTRRTNMAILSKKSIFIIHWPIFSNVKEVMDLSSYQWPGDKYYDFDIRIHFECK